MTSYFKRNDRFAASCATQSAHKCACIVYTLDVEQDGICFLINCQVIKYFAKIQGCRIS